MKVFSLPRKPELAVFALVGLISYSLPDRPPAVPDRDCDVILVSIDTLRADRLSCYGHRRKTSPHIDRLATDSVLFERFHYNGGYTLRSHLTMMTSLRPGAHGVTPFNGRALGSSRITLAEQLREAGFFTAAFVDAGWLRGRMGFVQGFDLYDEAGGRFEKIIPKALEWLDTNSDRRFFLFLHTYDVHSKWEGLPYDCPQEAELWFTSAIDADFDGCRGDLCASDYLLWANEVVRSGGATAEQILTREEIAFISALYDGCVAYVDAQIGHLVQRLRELDVYDSTLIVFTSDHGEEFAEHGLFLHAQYGFEEMSHLPLIIKFPDSWSAGKRIHHMSAMVDVMPTILESVGVEANSDIQGVSLLPSIVNDIPVRSAIFMDRVIRTQKWKYFARSHELFNLFADPLETTSETAREGNTAERLKRQIDWEREKDQRLLSAENHRAHLNPREIEQLQRMGYVVGSPSDGH